MTNIGRLRGGVVGSDALGRFDRAADTDEAAIKHAQDGPTTTPPEAIESSHMPHDSRLVASRRGSCAQMRCSSHCGWRRGHRGGDNRPDPCTRRTQMAPRRPRRYHERK